MPGSKKPATDALPKAVPQSDPLAATELHRQATKALLNRLITHYKGLLALHHWTVDWHFDRIAKDTAYGWVRAEVERRDSYDRASIVFDVERFTDSEDFANAVRHEMLHLMHAPFDLFYEAVMPLIPESAHPALDRVWHHACEKTVVGLERALDYGIPTPVLPPEA